jgi:DNA-binding transcriptional LysR family regulator
MFAREASPDYHERVLTICTSAGFTPGICHEVRHWPSVVSLVGQGLGVALVPAAVRRVAVEHEVAFVPLDAQGVQSQANCVWRVGDDNSALQAFLDDVRKAVKAGASRANRRS